MAYQEISLAAGAGDHSTHADQEREEMSADRQTDGREGDNFFSPRLVPELNGADGDGGIRNVKRIVIKNKATGETVASAEDPLAFEGNYYLDEKNVSMDQLEVTDRIYRCWYKGECFWIDLKNGDGSTQRNVAWVYREPSPGYEEIKDKIGFSQFPGGDLVMEDS